MITDAAITPLIDEDNQPQVRCRHVGVHRPHPYCNGQCPGQPCDHETLCCHEHSRDTARGLHAPLGARTSTTRHQNTAAPVEYAMVRGKSSSRRGAPNAATVAESADWQLL